MDKKLADEIEKELDQLDDDIGYEEDADCPDEYAMIDLRYRLDALEYDFDLLMASLDDIEEEQHRNYIADKLLLEARYGHSKPPHIADYWQ